MDIRKVLEQYDSMFGKETPEAIGDFLGEQLNIALVEGDIQAMFTLLNEQIGFCRDTNQETLCIQGCETLHSILLKMGIDGTLQYGKTLLNIANSYRAFGRYEEAARLFPKVQETYDNCLEEGNYEFAPLYNNWSLLYLSIKEYEKAIEMLKKTLDVIDRYEQAAINRATTRTNIACAIMSMPEGDEKEAERYLDESIEIFEKYDPKDYHYSGALSAKGDLLVRHEEYGEAIDKYMQAMDLIRLYVGDNLTTNDLMDKIADAACRMEN